MKKNLVMAAAKGYSFYDLEPFLQSFKKNCTSADLVLFVDELSDFTTKKIQSCVEGVTLIPFPANLKHYAIVNSRFIVYKKFLEEHPEYEKIFVTDIADVIFQADIFEKYSGKKNFLVYAAEAITVGEDPGGFNQLWTKTFLGEEGFQKLKNKTVLCAGTILGSHAEMKNLFQKLLDTIFDKTSHGIDQVFYIHIIHNKLVPIKNLIKSDVETGEILTCSVLKNYNSAGEKILRGDGKIPAVVHQYNRKSELIGFVDEVYREKVFNFDDNFDDVGSLVDQTLSLANVRQWKTATKIFVNDLLYHTEIKNFGGKLLKLYEIILMRTNPQDYESEVFNSAVQNALSLALTAKFDQQQLDKLRNYFAYSRQSFRTIIAPFEIFLSNAFMQLADMAYKSDDKNSCINYLEQIDSLDLPRNQNFYLMLAKVYREVGNKEKALQIYQKALDAAN